MADIQALRDAHPGFVAATIDEQLRWVIGSRLEWELENKDWKREAFYEQQFHEREALLVDGVERLRSSLSEERGVRETMERDWARRYDDSVQHLQGRCAAYLAQVSAMQAALAQEIRQTCRYCTAGRVPTPTSLGYMHADGVEPDGLAHFCNSGSLRAVQDRFASLTAEPPALESPSERKSLVRLNAERDSSYCPYCMRCTGLVRMRKVEDFYWRCGCGAEHDERRAVEMPSPPEGPHAPVDSDQLAMVVGEAVVDDRVCIECGRRFRHHAAVSETASPPASVPAKEET